jgi:DNA-binding CsgD family transcriptional regulator
VLYGRDPERDQIWALLEAARASRSGALVLRGDAGIGKTALLEDARERAADMHVLRARGVESESELPFAALHQLIRPALGHIERLPAPQAEALRGALGLADGSGQERFLVFAGCLSLLSELAERRPVLCLVDDAHWLDAGSSDALQFVARRLDAEGIVMLFAARDGELHPFEAADLQSLPVAGLDPDAAATLLSRGAGVDAAPSVRLRLVEQTRGNALALLEVPSALSTAQLTGDAPLPEALPLTHQVETVFLERVRRLPEEAQRLLLVAAADDAESISLVVRAAGALGVGPQAFGVAEEAGLLSVHGTRLEFRHPLVRSAVYEASTSTERRAAHRALADALEGDDEHADRRAWHLAASVLEPDEAVVTALDEAAARAEERTAHLAAARALQRAAELSSDDSARGRRLAGAARAASLAAADDLAAALASQARFLVDQPLLRAEIARATGLAEIRRGRPILARPVFVEAAAELASIDPSQALELLMYALWSANEAGDVAAHLDVARLAARFAPADAPDEWSSFAVVFLDGAAAMMTGETARGIPLIEKSIELAQDSPDGRSAYWAMAGAFWLGDEVRGQALAERAALLARTSGAIGLLAATQGVRSAHHFMAQRFADASVAAHEAADLAREVGAENLTLTPLGVLASVAAVRGHDEEAERLAAAVVEVAVPRGLGLRTATATRALGLLDLARGRWLEALERFEEIADVGPGHGNAVLALFSVPDRVEAAVRAGVPDRARNGLEQYERWVGEAKVPWAYPCLAACQAQLAESADETTEHFEEALGLADDAHPFDLARIELRYGEHLRRERRRIDAREQLRAALEGFERLEAEPWAERARAELRATGETARKRDPSLVDQLTPQELQIARFVAEGLTNKEVAAQLFLSPRTIDSHLRNVFAKLGISSRTQLARLPLAEEAAAVTAGG